jgi:hypothetical protein
MKLSKSDILVPKGRQFLDCAVVVDRYNKAGNLVEEP